MEKSLQNSSAPKLEDLKPISTDEIVDNSITDFDLYVKLQQSVTLYAPSPYSWNQEELARLKASGYDALYYSNSEQEKVEAYRLVAKLPKIDTQSEPRKRILSLTDAGYELTRILYDYPLDATTLSKVTEVGHAMIDTIQEDRTCVAALGKLVNHDYYTYYHSARVAAYALAIAVQQGLSQHQRLEELAIGCLLHDIGKSKVDQKIITKAQSLNSEEWKIMRKHPEYGDGIVKEAILSSVPRGIILHHHERMDGSGYPHGLASRELLPEVKIAAFADTFDALTTNRPYQNSRTRFEALDLIRFKLLDGLDREAFKAMVAILEKGKV
ncbi:MAG: HD domain-containing protein [Bdellovibrionota bacterium]